MKITAPKAIRYADPDEHADVQVLAEAFSNKSICWHQLKEYQFAIDDARYAKSFGYCQSEDRRIKTEKRIKLCKSELFSQKSCKIQNYKFHKVLSTSVNDDAIVYDWNEQCGRHLRAKRNIECGEVLIIERAKVAFLH